MSHKSLGIVSRLQYTVNRLGLAPGNSYFIFTDGIPEVINAREEMFGSNRLQATLDRLTKSSARETVETVLHAVNAFVGGIPQNDDIAALAMRRCPERV